MLYLLICDYDTEQLPLPRYCLLKGVSVFSAVVCSRDSYECVLQLVVWLAGWLVYRMVGFMSDLLAFLAGSLSGFLVGSLVGFLVGSLACSLTDWLAS